MDAVLVIDKPAGLTSHDVVARVRRLLGERSVGHLGTLDHAVYALHASNGTVLWRQQVDGWLNLQPLMSGGVIYVSTVVGQNGPYGEVPPGYIYALGASDGRILWRHTTNGYPSLTPSADGRRVPISSSSLPGRATAVRSC